MTEPMYYGLDGQPCSEEEGLTLIGSQMLRRVALTNVGEWMISTVFLVIDHSHGMGERPVLWETMSFDPAGEPVDCWRYSSREEAQRGHNAMVAEVRAGIQEFEDML